MGCFFSIPSRSASVSAVYSIEPMCRTVFGANGLPSDDPGSHPSLVDQTVDGLLDLRGGELV